MKPLIVSIRPHPVWRGELQVGWKDATGFREIATRQTYADVYELVAQLRTDYHNRQIMIVDEALPLEHARAARLRWPPTLLQKLVRDSRPRWYVIGLGALLLTCVVLGIPQCG